MVSTDGEPDWHGELCQRAGLEGGLLAWHGVCSACVVC